MSFEKSRTWALVSLSNFKNNIEVIKKHIGPNTKLMAVIKADAYGHGVKEITKEAMKCKVDYYAVATVDEAIEIREVDDSTPILVLSYTTSDRALDIIKYNIIPAVFNFSLAEKLNEYAANHGAKIKVHIKLDTGMTRLGFDAFDKENTINQIIKISKMSNIIIEGIFTHFADSDNESDEGFTKLQFDRFNAIVKELNDKGLNIPIKHVCNSAAAIAYKEMHLDMVRCGIILYGYYPSKYLEKIMPGIRPVLSLKSSLLQIRSLNCDVTVSYGRTYKASKNQRIGTVPIGYADGFNRQLSNKFYVLICGKKANIIGRVCMDQIIVDITDIPEAKEGSIVTLIGEDGELSVTANDMAEVLDTISYEILCDIGKRIPRIYVE